MQGEELLRVDSINVFHGSFQALYDVSLVAMKGEIVALVGANSSGKSTLLDAISGILHPTTGRIEFAGKDITYRDAHEIVSLGMAHVPEGRRVFPEMSVLDNLVVASYTRRARAKVKENLKLVFQLFPRLEERQSQMAKSLSGGEQQMLALGRGLMSEPRIILIDEMSLGLAPVVVKNLFGVLREIRKRGVTILLVEQNVRLSLEEADRAYILKNGRVVMSGDAAKLRNEDEVRNAYFGV